MTKTFKPKLSEAQQNTLKRLLSGPISRGTWYSSARFPTQSLIALENAGLVWQQHNTFMITAAGRKALE